jgi:hypothetical protein
VGRRAWTRGKRRSPSCWWWWERPSFEPPSPEKERKEVEFCRGFLDFYGADSRNFILKGMNLQQKEEYKNVLHRAQIQIIGAFYARTNVF